MKEDKQNGSVLKNVLRKRTVAIASFALGIAVTFGFISLKFGFAGKNNLNAVASPDDINLYEIKRLKGFKNIQPVVSIDPKTESQELAPLKAELTTLIDSLRKGGSITEVSIFLKNLRHGNWISINSEQRYHPASLMKVPLALAVLKMAEATPGLLEKKIAYKKHPEKVMYQQNFVSKGIVEGQTYTVHELIYHCLANSDNNATHALATNVNYGNVMNLFKGIGLPEPDLNDNNYTITAQEFSTFMDAIFNSAFLSPEYSEYAAEIMAHSSFKEGFSKSLPKDIRSWSKFGEWDRNGTDLELHESATIFLDGKPYLLTVMTRGNDINQLTSVLQLTSALVIKNIIKHQYGIAKSTSSFTVGC